MSARDYLIGSERSVAHRLLAWALSLVLPAAVAIALLSFRSSFGLAGFLIWALLAVLVVALIGGVWPALLATGVGFVAAGVAYTPPYGSLRVDFHVNLIAFIAFLVVGAFIGVLVDELARLAREQAALRRVATFAARALPLVDLFAAITEEIGKIFNAAEVNLHRSELDGQQPIVATWSRADRAATLNAQFATGGFDPSTVVDTGARGHIGSAVDDAGSGISPSFQGRGTRATTAVSISVSGRQWGSMVVRSRSRRASRNTEERLAHFTDLLVMALENAESRSELAASRARVVAAADETRRRIERDLHDGAQQRLVSLGLELRTVESSIPLEFAEVRMQVSDATVGLNEVLQDLQEISRGIHPAILSRGGLGPAIRGLARRSAVTVELDVNVDRRLPPGVEVAAYYVVSESLTNVAKHANANLVHVGLKEDDGVMLISIRDDGIGGADPNRGSGLVGLRDRVEVIGGTIDIASSAGFGTVLEVTIPIDVE